MRNTKRIIQIVFFLLILGLPAKADDAPRIINIINFCRQNDYREANSEERLYKATSEEARLLRKYNLKGTFLLQYDALIDERYQKLMRDSLSAGSEVGGWWEITKPHAEAAGLKWRGAHPWVSEANIGFTTGYSQEDRKKLVDVYMAKFKSIFGKYPSSIGSWYIDAYTLAYMRDRYHIVASCNCRDQIGTDGYTLWGGYWNQAYYPSRVNGYMPAQTADGQIDVPVFRMLGSDPIYQYESRLGGNGQGVVTLEPVYPETGGNPEWVEKFLNVISEGACLAFNYTQAGQENSFGWEKIGKGLTMQMEIIAKLVRQGKLTNMTLKESGKWFKKHFKVTPPTAVTALEDLGTDGKKAVWYDSRYYRAHMLIKDDGEFILRDIHLFDQRMKSHYYDKASDSTKFVFKTLPFVDGFEWSQGNTIAGLRFVKYGIDGFERGVRLSNPKVTEVDRQTLRLSLEDEDGGQADLTFYEDRFTVDYHPKDSGRWAMELTAAPGKCPFTNITNNVVSSRFDGFDYRITALKGYFQTPTRDNHYVLRLLPDDDNISIDCTNSSAPVEADKLMGNRFLTMCIAIRTHTVEVSRDVLVYNYDESSIHTLQAAKELREAFAKYNPEGRLTWGFSLNALEDQRKNYQEIREYAKECHYKYGDEISYCPCYFPAMYLPRERINKEMHEAIEEITNLVGNNYRPQCIMSGFLSSQNMKYLAEKENIHVVQGNIWSQHNVDAGGADGSISYPYYPSIEHFCKPAQGKEDMVDCVNLDGWTCDFICARNSGSNGHQITGYNSRRGVGPIETYKDWGVDLGLMEVIHTEGIHYDKGYEMNGFGWIADIWELSLFDAFKPGQLVKAMESWVKRTKELWPDVKFVTFGEFGEAWRSHYKSNDFDYRFFERGSGFADSYNNLELRWFMNSKFRLALLRDWHRNTTAKVIDFTTYNQTVSEPADPSPEKPYVDWSLMNVLNQKQSRPQDTPRFLNEMSEDSKSMIRSVYPELFKNTE